MISLKNQSIVKIQFYPFENDQKCLKIGPLIFWHENSNFDSVLLAKVVK